MAEQSRPERPAIADDLARRLPRDAVFILRLVGESPLELQRHFQSFIAATLAQKGVTPDSHPMIHGFIEAHAVTLRDFVLAGIGMVHQLRLGEMERLLGDTTSILSVDIWDQLRSHVETAEAQFILQAEALPEQLEEYRLPERNPPLPGLD